jgi:nucleoside-diphosphate-sugar epimerase
MGDVAKALPTTSGLSEDSDLRKSVVLITGAAGEIGHSLIHRLHGRGDFELITLDLKTLDDSLDSLVERQYVGSVTDNDLLDTILAEYSVTLIFHLAALLSTRSEFTPRVAHRVNVGGTMNLLEFAQAQARTHGENVLFFYPSSIAAYGFASLEEKVAAGAVRENDHNAPTTMYGCNKLSCEHLGRYYARHYRQLDVESPTARVDFRSLRFPGLISAFTVPSGGTSDFAPEMLHAAAQGRPYDCFVRSDARIPFMAMPDAVDAILDLSFAPAKNVRREVYNLEAFHPSAAEIRELVLEAFPDARIDYALDPKRMAIIDSWPEAVDDSAAREDWGYSPSLDLEAAFREYLVPNIRKTYAG